MKSTKSSRKKIIRVLILSLVIILLAGGAFLYKKIFSPVFDIKQTAYIYIDERKDYNELLLQLQTTGHIKDIGLFKKMATVTKYPQKMRTGRYAIRPDMTVRELLSMLSNGMQSPVRLTFNNLRLKTDFTKRIDDELMLNGDSLLARLDDPAICASFGFDTATIVSMFIPNTYEIYWNVDIDPFLQRMKKEYDRFWTPERLAKAEAIPMTPVQVSTLASIVEEETAATSEYPIIAGLYINRLKQGMLMQACPTVKFAVGDFSLQRILNVHLQTDSPYNTYRYPGLPPGPIRIPSIRGLDAVLNYNKNNYLFMCAKEDFSGKHNFATNGVEHSRNAEKYRRALNERGIR